MANSKFRCSGCREYRPTELRRRYGTYQVCSWACLITAQKRTSKADKKRAKPELQSKLTRAIRHRDGDVCRWCGKTSGLEVHHIDYRSELGGDDPTNLITLCGAHHVQAHSNKRLYKPLLKAYIWFLYVEGRRVTIPQIMRWLRRRREERERTRVG
jgi:hypothetical protein